jgi:hypothetical protein
VETNVLESESLMSDEGAAEEPASEAELQAEAALESVTPEEPRAAAPPETRPLPGTLPGVDDDAWLDEDVEAKLTGSFKTV